MLRSSFPEGYRAGFVGAVLPAPSDYFAVRGLSKFPVLPRDEIAEELDVAGFARRPRFLASIRADSMPHSSASFRRRNVSLTYFPFRRTWTFQGPDFSLVIVAARVRSGAPDAAAHSACLMPLKFMASTWTRWTCAASSMRSNNGSGQPTAACAGGT